MLKIIGGYLACAAIIVTLYGQWQKERDSARDLRQSLRQAEGQVAALRERQTKLMRLQNESVKFAGDVSGAAAATPWGAVAVPGAVRVELCHKADCTPFDM